jgi:hypothetical protein
MLDRLRIGTRVILGFALATLLCWGIALVARLEAQRIGAFVDVMSGASFPAVAALGDVEEAQSALDGTVHGLVNPHLDGEQRERLYADLLDAFARMAEGPAAASATEQAAASSQQSSGAAAGLAARAQELASMVGTFRLEK